MLYLNIILLLTLLYIAIDDLCNFRIRNEAIFFIGIMLLIKFFLAGTSNELLYHFIYEFIALLLILTLYYFRAFGGGDAKLLIVSIFWLNIDNWYDYFCYLSIITLLYSCLSLTKVIPQYQTGRGTRIPFGPCICLAWAINIF